MGNDKYNVLNQNIKNDGVKSSKIYDPFKQNIGGSDLDPSKVNQGSPFENYKLEDYSKYDEGISTAQSVSDIQEHRAQRQPIGEKWAAGVANFTTSALTSFAKNMSYYVDIPQYKNLLTGTEEEFGNWFADGMDKIQEELKLPVYTPKDVQGKFAPWSASWWANNMESLGTTAGAIGSTLLMDYLTAGAANYVGGARLASFLNMGRSEIQTVRAVNSALMGRYAENTMEGKQTFDATYQQVLQQTGDPIKAKEVAAEAARANWMANNANLLLDIPQHLLRFKAWGSLVRDSEKLAEAAAKKTMPNLLAQMGMESIEEANQFISDKETTYNALLKHNLIKPTDFNNRLKDYLSDGDFWTAAFMGAAGGGLFHAISSITDKKQYKNEKDRLNHYQNMIQKFSAIVNKDPLEFSKVTDTDFIKQVIDHHAAGTLDLLRKDLDTIASLNKTDAKDLKLSKDAQERINKAKEDLDFFEDTLARLKNDLKIDNSTILHAALGTHLDQRLTERRVSSINKELEKLHWNDQTEGGLTTGLSELKQASLKLNILENSSKEVKDKHKDEIESLRKYVKNAIQDIIDNPLHSDLNTEEEVIDKTNTSNNILQLLYTKHQIDAQDDLKEINKKISEFNSKEGRDKIQTEWEAESKKQAQAKENERKEAERKAAEAAKKAKEESEKAAKEADKDLNKIVNNDPEAVTVETPATPETNGAKPESKEKNYQHMINPNEVQFVGDGTRRIIDRTRPITASMVTNPVTGDTEVITHYPIVGIEESVPEYTFKENGEKGRNLIIQNNYESPLTKESFTVLQSVDLFDYNKFSAYTKDQSVTFFAQLFATKSWDEIKKGLKIKITKRLAVEGNEAKRSETGKTEVFLTKEKEDAVNRGEKVATVQRNYGVDMILYYEDPNGEKIDMPEEFYEFMDPDWFVKLENNEVHLIDFNNKAEVLELFRMEERNQYGERIYTQLTDAQYETLRKSHEQAVNISKYFKALYEIHGEVDLAYEDFSKIIEITPTSGMLSNLKLGETTSIQELAISQDPEDIVIFSTYRGRTVYGDFNAFRNKHGLSDLPERPFFAKNWQGLWALIKTNSGEFKWVAVHANSFDAADEAKVISSFKKVQEQLDALNPSDRDDYKNAIDIINKNIKVFIASQPGMFITFSATIDPNDSENLLLSIKISRKVKDEIRNIYIPLTDISSFDAIAKQVNKVLEEKKTRLDLKESIDNIKISKNSFRSDIKIAKEESEQSKISFEEVQNLKTSLKPEVLSHQRFKIDFKGDVKVGAVADTSAKNTVEPINNESSPIVLDPNFIGEEETSTTSSFKLPLSTDNIMNPGEVDDATKLQLLTYDLEQAKDIGNLDGIFDIAQKIAELKAKMGVNKLSETLPGTINIVEETLWIQQVLPDIIKIADISEIAAKLNNKGLTWGHFFKQVIYLNKQAGKGTGYHEAFHAVFRSFLTEKEIKRYLMLAEREISPQKLSKEEIEAFKLNNNVPTFSDEEVKQLILEEYIADKFQDYKNNESKNKDSKFIKFFKNLMQLIRKVLGLKNINDLFVSINKGAFKHSTLKNNRFTTYGYGANKIIPGFTANETTNLISRIKGFAINEGILKDLESKEDIDATLVDKAINKILHYYNPTNPDNKEILTTEPNIDIAIEKYEAICAIYSKISLHRAIIKEEASKAIRRAKYDPNAKLQEQEDEEDLDGRTASQYDKNFADTGGYDNANRELKEYIEQTLYLTYDPVLGRNVWDIIDAQGVYASLERAFTGGVKSSELFEKFEYLAKDNPMTAALFERLKKDTGWNKDNHETFFILDRKNIDNLNGQRIVKLFQKAFEEEAVEHSQVIIQNDPKTGNVRLKVYSSNKNEDDISKVIVRNWEKDFNYNKLHNSARFNEALKELQSVASILTGASTSFLYKGQKTTDITKIKDIFASVGLDIPLSYIRHSFTQSSPFTTTRISYDDINNIIASISSKNNIFDKEDDNNVYSRLVNIANNSLAFNENIYQRTFRNAENKSLFSFVKNFFLATKLREISEKYANLNDLKNNVNDYLQFNTLIGLPNASEVFKQLSITLIGDNRESTVTYGEDGEVINELKDVGITFKDTNPKTLLLTKLSLFLDGINNDVKKQFAFFNTQQFEAGVTGIGIKLPVNQSYNYSTGAVSEEFVDYVYNTVFLQEHKRLNDGFTFQVHKNNKNKFVNIEIFNRPEYSYLKNVEKLDANDALVAKEAIREHFRLLNVGLLNKIKVYGLEGKLANEIADKGLTLEQTVGLYNSNLFLNAIGINQLLTGDLSAYKNSNDQVKRAKGQLAKGTSEGSFTYVLTTEASVFVNKDNTERIPLAGLTKDEISKYRNNPEYIEVNSDDGGTEITMAQFINHMFEQGKLDSETYKLYKKIEDGIKPDEYEKIMADCKKHHIDLISLKTVLYDYNSDTQKGVYFKESKRVLTKNFTSYWDVIKKAWLPIPGREALHNKRIWMEKNNIGVAIPQSASKLIGGDEYVVDHTFFNDPESVNHVQEKIAFYDGNNHRLQVVNESHNYGNIKLGTQAIQYIISELPKSKENLEKIQQFSKLLSDIRMRSFIGAISYVNNGKISEDGISRDIKYFVKKILETAEASGVSSGELEFLKANISGTDFEYNINLPININKMMQYFFAHFSRGVFSTQVKGRKFTLSSPRDFNIMFYEKDGKEITVSQEEFQNSQNQAKYKDMLEKGELKTRPLKWSNVDEENSLAEIAITRGTAKLLGIKIGDEITSDLFTGFGNRIPTQSHHSMVGFKVVEFLPEYFGDTLIAPEKLFNLSGADLDIDSLFTFMKDFYKTDKGKVVVYGKSKDDYTNYDEFVTWELENNSLIKSIVKDYSDKVGKDKDLIKSIYPRAFAYAGLPGTFEEWQEKGKLKSGGALQNDLLDMYIGFLQNPEIKESLETPATLEGIEKDASMLHDKYSKSENEYAPHYSEAGIENARKNNMEGRSLTGPTANNSKIGAWAYTNGLNLGSSFSITINGKTYDSLQTLKEDTVNLKENGELEVLRDNTRVADTSSSSVSAAVDNAKHDGLMKKLNLNNHTTGILTTLYRLGIGMHTVNAIGVQKALREFSDAMLLQDEPNFKITLNNIREEYINKYKTLLDKIKTSNLPAEDKAMLLKEFDIKMPKQDAEGQINYKDLIEAIEHNTNTTVPANNTVETLVTALKNEINFITVQLNVIDIFSKGKEISQALFNINSLLSLNKEFIGTFEDYTKINRALSELRSEKTAKVLPNVQEAMSRDLVLTNNIANMESTIKIMQYYFIHFSPKVGEITSKLAKNFKMNTFSINGYKKLMSYLLFKAHANLNNITYKGVQSYSGYTSLLFKDIAKALNEETIVDKFNRIKNYPIVKNNKFLAYIKAKSGGEINNKNGFDVLDALTSTKLSDKTVDILQNAFSELFAIHTNIDLKLKVGEITKAEYDARIDIKDFVTSLVKANILRNGLEFVPNSLVKWMNGEVLNDISKTLDLLHVAMLDSKNYVASSDNKVQTFSSLTIEDVLGIPLDAAIKEFLERFFAHMSNASDMINLNLNTIKPYKDKYDNYRGLNIEHDNGKIVIKTVQPFSEEDFKRNTYYQIRINLVDEKNGQFYKPEFPDYFVTKLKDESDQEGRTSFYKAIEYKSLGDGMYETIYIPFTPVRLKGINAIILSTTALENLSNLQQKQLQGNQQFNSPENDLFEDNYDDMSAEETNNLGTVEDKMPESKREYTPENITTLKPNEVFVFGSNMGNSKGANPTHGKGAALLAKQKFGAIQGQVEGLQGQSYAIVTKKFWDVEKSSSLEEIEDGIAKFLSFAQKHPELKFYVTKIGSSLAGYTVEEIKNIWEKMEEYPRQSIDGVDFPSIPDNVILPREYEVRENKVSKVQSEQEEVKTDNTVNPDQPIQLDFGFIGDDVENLPEVPPCQ